MARPLATGQRNAAPTLHPRAIVVTGGSGFVGRHLLAALTQRPAPCVIRSFDTVVPADGLPDGVQTLYGNLEDAQAVRDAVDGADAVVHLAAVVEPDGGDVERLSRVNVEGTKTAYREAIAAGASVFLHMSSAGVYGAPRRRGRFVEGDAPSPVTPYQTTKWEAEQALAEIDGAATTLNVLRPAGIYGPGSRLEIPQYQQLHRQRWVVELRGASSCTRRTSTTLSIRSWRSSPTLRLTAVSSTSAVSACCRCRSCRRCRLKSSASDDAGWSFLRGSPAPLLHSPSRYWRVKAEPSRPLLPWPEASYSAPPSTIAVCGSATPSFASHRYVRGWSRPSNGRSSAASW